MAGKAKPIHYENQLNHSSADLAAMVKKIARKPVKAYTQRRPRYAFAIVLIVINY